MQLIQSKTIEVAKDDDGTVHLKIDLPEKSHNVLNKQVLADLEAALDRIEGERTLPVLVVRSGKKTGFLAGADLHEFLDISSPEEARAVSERGQTLFARLANLSMPSLAMISGPCLGGGLELALACDYRLVYEKGSTQLGLPEVQLGLLPAWGGTQRLPRIIGLEKTLQMILAGKRFNAVEAYQAGLADALATNETELRVKFASLTARAIQEGKVRREKLPLIGWRQKFLESTRLGRYVIFRNAERLLEKKVPDDMPAPKEALETIRHGLREGAEAGYVREREAAGKLATSTACRNLIGIFVGREQARKLPAKWSELALPEGKRVGVVGGGIMGAGIAQLAAIKGCEVVLQEINEEALGAGLLRIQKLFQKAIERGLLSLAEMEKRLAGVRGTLTWEGFDDVDLVVEAAVENLDAKRSIFAELLARTKPETILATNTSSLSVAKIQEGLEHPQRIAGLHFFNPVHKMPLVEVAYTDANDERTRAFLSKWAIDLGKTPVQVKDSPGFVVNRILMPYLSEAVTLVAEGLSIQQVDRSMGRFGMPMGPLELLDQVGLDVAAHVAASMEPIMRDRFGSNEAFEKMRQNDWLGQKSGTGFYTHGKKAKPNTLAENLLRASHPTSPSVSLPLTARISQARERMVLLMVNEAALALSESLTEDADTLDLAMILGTGWAPHRGGPLRYAQTRGVCEVYEALSNLAEQLGKRFTPCEELVRNQP